MRGRSRGRGLWALVILVVVLTAALPVDEVVHDLVFRYVVSHEARLLANGFTLLGTTWAGGGVLGTLAIVAYRTVDAALWRASVGGLAGVLLGGAATQVVKHVACRARPRFADGWGVGSTEHPTAPARGFFRWPCVLKVRYNSFPSGHATTAFAMAAGLSAITPTRRRAWLAVAAGIGASRVLLNAHFLSDVLGGAVIGWWAGQGGQGLASRFAPRLAAWLPRPTGIETPPPAGTTVT